MLIIILFIILLYIIFTPQIDHYDNIKSDEDIKLNSELAKISLDDQRLFIPLKPILINAQSNAYNMAELPITADEIKEIIKAIPTHKLDLVSGELSVNMRSLIKPSEINNIPKYIKHTIPAKTYYIIKKPLQEFLNAKSKVCNLNTPCNLIYILNRFLNITRTGTNDNNYNYIVEGQILIAIKSRPIQFVIKYMVSTLNKLTIHEIHLDGFGFKTLGYQDKENINTPVYISNEPVGHQAFDNSLYLNNVYESPNKKPHRIFKNKDIVKEIVKKQEAAYDTTYDYRCFEKGEITTQAECERKFDKDNNPITPNVWDKYCEKNSECPFYKANKNYPNKFGGCINKKCEVPIGVTSISPRKYTNIEKALCGNCKSESVYCCKEQADKQLYPDLKSPDFRFKDDYSVRVKYGIGE